MLYKVSQIPVFVQRDIQKSQFRGNVQNALLVLEVILVITVSVCISLLRKDEKTCLFS